MRSEICMQPAQSQGLLLYEKVIHGKYSIFCQERHVMAATMKMDRAMRLAPVTPEYLLVRYC